MSSDPGLMDGITRDATETASLSTCSLATCSLATGSLVAGAVGRSGDQRSPSVSSMGVCASQTLLGQSSASVKGEVISSFEHSVLVLFDNRIICVTVLTVGDGPFNMVVSASDLQTLKNTVKIGATVFISGANLCFQAKTSANILSLTFQNASLWDQMVQPLQPAPQQYWGAASDDQWLINLISRTEELLLHASLDSLAGTVLEAAGLYNNGGVAEDTESPLMGLVIKTVSGILDASRDSFGSWLKGQSTYPQQLDALLGLGPGLTPSGDDFLAGCLVALRIAGGETLALDWHDHLKPLAGSHTHPLSAQMLEQAAFGRVAQKIIHLNSQLAGRRSPDIAACCDLISDIGHSSGWDYLAGFYYCCQQILSAGNDSDDKTLFKYHRKLHA